MSGGWMWLIGTRTIGQFCALASAPSLTNPAIPNEPGPEIDDQPGRRQRPAPGSGVPALRAACGGLVAAGGAGADGGLQVGAGDRGGGGDVVDGGAESAGDVDPGSFGVGGCAAGAPGQAGGMAQFGDQGLAFGVGALGGGWVAGPVGGGEFMVELADPPAASVPCGGVQH